MAAWRSYVDPSDMQVWWTDDAGNFLPDAEYKAGPGKVATGGGVPPAGGTSQYDDYFSNLLKAMYGSNQDYFDWDKQKFNQGLYAQLAQALLQGATGLRGPANYRDYEKFTSGGKSALERLATGDVAPAFSAPTGHSAPITIQKILDDLGLGNLGGSGGTQPGTPADNGYLDYIWKNRPDLAGFYSSNGWDISTPDKQRAAVMDWIKNVDPQWKGMTPGQVAGRLGYTGQPTPMPIGGWEPPDIGIGRSYTPPDDSGDWELLERGDTDIWGGGGVAGQAFTKYWKNKRTGEIRDEYGRTRGELNRLDGPPVGTGRPLPLGFGGPPQIGTTQPKLGPNPGPGFGLPDPNRWQGEAPRPGNPRMYPGVPRQVNQVLTPNPTDSAPTNQSYDLAPLPHQVNPMVWDSLSDTQKKMVLTDAMMGKTSAGAITAEDYLEQMYKARPKGTAPKRVSYNWGQPTPLF